MPDSPDERDLLDRAVAGDETAFAALIEPHKRALFRHCYRMLGSGADAEDASQDALERAWRRLTTYDGSGTFGGWLYRIATNVCLDAKRAGRTRLDPTGEGPAGSPSGFAGTADPALVWVEPVSDADLGAAGDPQDKLIRREDVSLAFVAALQRLAPRQRAALLLHDVLGFSHSEVSEVLAVSPSAVNSLLSRARDAARARPTGSWPDRSDDRVRDLLDRYVRAWELADINGFVELVADDIRFSMPPLTAWFLGRDAVAGFVEQAIFANTRPHGVPIRPGWCNGQPAFATYEPTAEGLLVANGLQLLELDQVHDRLLIRAIVSYRDPDLPGRCGLPSILS